MNLFRSSFMHAASLRISTAPDPRYWLSSSLAALTLSVIPVYFSAAMAKPLFYPVPASTQQDQTPEHEKKLDRIKKEPTTARAKLVAIDASALNGNSVEITLDSGKVLTYLKTRIDTNNHGLLTWYGDSQDKQGSAIFVVNHGIVTGSIRYHGDLYKIQSVGNGLHAVIETDSAGLPPEHPPSSKPGTANANSKTIR